MTITQEKAVEGANILTLISDPGNRRVLEEWIQPQDSYHLVGDAQSIPDGSFDCCLFDREMLFEHGTELLERKSSEPVVLPYLLLVPESNHRMIRDRLQREYPDLWEIIDGLIDMPLTEYQLAEQLETYLRLREQSLSAHKQREQLRQIRDQHTGHGVMITDRQGRIEYINEAFEAQSGYSESEVIGENPRILSSGEHDEAFYEDLWETILSGEVWQGTVINEQKNGSKYVVDQTIAPVEGPDSGIEQFITVNHEITELKELEYQLRNQREQLEVLNRVLRHDIRNDMSIILNWAELLEDEVTAVGAERLEKIIQAGRHVVELTTVSRNLSELIHEDSEAELESVSLRNSLSAELEKRQETYTDATIRMPKPPDDGVYVRANKLLSSVFRNLINNAVQHNDSDMPVVTITVVEHNETVEVRVADNGPGIPEKVKQTLFSEGEKGLDSEGTGIGLFLVQSLVESYQGSVWMEDSSEAIEEANDGDKTGAVFVVELQRAEEADASDGGLWQ